MPKIIRPLTDKQVANAKFLAKDYSLYDGRGLKLKIRAAKGNKSKQPSGSKIWLFEYTSPTNKKRNQLTLGKYPDISLNKAREKSHAIRQIIADGEDPKIYLKRQQQGDEEKSRLTFERVARQWHEKESRNWSPDYADDVMRSLERNAFPFFGQTPIHQMNRQDVINALDSLERRGTLETLRRICQRIGSIMLYAINRGYVSDHPLRELHSAFSAPVETQFPSITPKQLPTLMRRLARAQIKLTTRAVIEWQLHTMTRPGEAACARWQHIDLKNKIWVIPAEEMKMKREHIVPLSTQALQLLEAMHPISGHREFIFPGDRNPRSHIHKQAANMALKRMGYQGKLVSHGLRSLASTTLNEQDRFQSDWIEMQLAHHEQNSSRRAYNRALYLEQRREMLQWWSDHIDSCSIGNLSIVSIMEEAMQSK
ncbi:tyrosine-type recombinase/integrase [Corallincola platygyrae]|uniref:Tyrosine-type recombinase/integrase n=1 Tax=Corallincola platygyrae TaxID=1193278 RepID=A0ABW4XKY0_9GAMM